MTKFQLANRALVAKNYSEAIKLFIEHADENDQDFAKCHVRIAECYLRGNILSTPVEVVPGVTLVSQGDRENAEKHYRLALEKDPYHEPALYKLATLLPDKSDEKYALLERAVKGSPGYLCLIEFGDLLRSIRKDYQGAYDIFRQAIEHSPKAQTAYQKIQYICRKQGRVDEAKEWGQKWKEIDATRKGHR